MAAFHRGGGRKDINEGVEPQVQSRAGLVGSLSGKKNAPALGSELISGSQGEWAFNNSIFMS
ncbi:hypothetical protein ACRRTK_009547 [Alexandromys fortis]